MKKCEFDDHTIIYTNTIKLPLESLGIYIFVRGFRTGYKWEGRAFTTVLKKAFQNKRHSSAGSLKLQNVVIIEFISIQARGRGNIRTGCIFLVACR